MNSTNRQIFLCDTTLRDGAQAPGICLSADEKHAIADALINAGIDELEAGIPAMGQESVAFLSDLVSMHPDVPVSCWCRCRREDLEAAAGTGASIVHISVPASPILLESLGMSWEDIFGTFQSVASAASDMFANVSLGIQDAFRTPPERIRMLSETAAGLSFYRIRIADSVGTALPEDVRGLVTAVGKEFNVSVAFHGHNDLGLATANSLAAAEAGAMFLDVTVNGIGERAGNTKLHEIAAVLHMHKRLNTGFDLSGIQDISALVSRQTNRAFPVNEPIIGEQIFTHSSGIHCSSIIKNELSYQPFPADFVGRDGYTFLAGTHSGTKGIAKMLESEGISAKADTIRAFSMRVKQKSASERRTFTATELAQEFYHFNRNTI